MSRWTVAPLLLAAMTDGQVGSIGGNLEPVTPVRGDLGDAVGKPSGKGSTSCLAGQSFAAGTLVLLASGKAIPISKLKR
jgi:hypothetical protein